MRGFPRRYKIIARRGSYHGMTYGAMSLTQLRNEAHFGPFMYGVSHVPHPNRYRSDFGVEGEQADIMAARYVEQEIEYQGPETVAAVIAEPISTAAGVQVPVEDLLADAARDLRQARRPADRRRGDQRLRPHRQALRHRALRHRAGHHDDGQGALLRLRADRRRHRARRRSSRSSRSKRRSPFGHLLTFGGHPVCAAAALKNLEIFERGGLGRQRRDDGRLPQGPPGGAAGPPLGRRCPRRRAADGDRVRHEQGEADGDRPRTRPSPSGSASC